MYSLEARLKRRLLVGVLLVSVVLGLAVRTEVNRQQREMLDYQLEQVARAMLLSDLQDLQAWDNDPALHLDMQIWDRAGNRLYRSSAQIGLGADTSPGFSVLPSGPQADAVILRVFTLKGAERTIQVMHSRELRRALSRDAEFQVLLPTLLAMLFVAIMVGATIRKGLEPIRELDEELSQRDVASLQPVSLVHAPVELDRVVRTFNRLLLQLDASIQAHKRFIANAAHELRTPITALRLEVDNLAHGEDPVQVKGAVRRLTMGVHRAQRLLQQMLTLARLEARTNSRPWTSVDLVGLAQESMMDLSVLGSQRGIEFAFEASGSTVVQGDPDDLRLLLDNLLGNALKFSPPNTSVELSIHQQGDAVILLLRDHGPGIAPALRERVLMPFVRSNPTIEGSGLGLTIVFEVIQSHGATLQLEDPPEGQGLQVRVSFGVDRPVLHTENQKNQA
ncbi:HAMP domain-containing sensor histidine kinase [Rhodoferax sp.]|uniref:sensor histidine kinase n=1 Tax=Rhodoferax sp. TaxID=50421 RepID=UPI0026043A1B|nr:HAMP domain-containing sensor histidine kinase [Rhodoferax sp.]MDD3937058.1 HAMP domain-containing sensor histidine kinase [Rhodoferax sp.]